MEVLLMCPCLYHEIFARLGARLDQQDMQGSSEVRPLAEINTSIYRTSVHNKRESILLQIALWRHFRWSLLCALRGASHNLLMNSWWGHAAFGELLKQKFNQLSPPPKDLTWNELRYPPYSLILNRPPPIKLFPQFKVPGHRPLKGCNTSRISFSSSFPLKFLIPLHCDWGYR